MGVGHQLANAALLARAEGGATTDAQRSPAGTTGSGGPAQSPMASRISECSGAGDAIIFERKRLRNLSKKDSLL